MTRKLNYLILALIILLTIGCTQVETNGDLTVMVYNPVYGSIVSDAYVEVYRYSDRKTIAYGYTDNTFKVVFKGLLGPEETYLVKASHKGRDGDLFLLKGSGLSHEVVVDLSQKQGGIF